MNGFGFEKFNRETTMHTCDKFGFEAYTNADVKERETFDAYWANYEVQKKAEEAHKEEIRLLKKANRTGKTVKEVKAEEKAKAEERYIKAKIKRYTKEIEEMERILAYKKAWLKEHNN